MEVSRPFAASLKAYFEDAPANVAGIDAEVAEFFGDGNAIHISESENVRLRWMVHKRVLTVMVRLAFHSNQLMPTGFHVLLPRFVYYLYNLARLTLCSSA